MAPRARRATAADLPRIADTLSGAFAPYDFVRSALPGERYAERLRELYLLFGGLALRAGEVWVAGDGVAAALWQPPGAVPLRDPAADARLAELLGEGLERYLAAAEQNAEHRPAGAHWYLDVLGTDPGRRRAGLATAVLTPVLHRCDAGGLVAFTDTSSEENLAFYARLGFGVCTEYDEPRGGSHVWMLERPPRG